MNLNIDSTTCYHCTADLYMTATVLSDYRYNRKTFHCLHCGNSMAFVGKSKAEKELEKLKPKCKALEGEVGRAKGRAQQERDAADRNNKQNRRLLNQLRAQRGATTRMKNKIKQLENEKE